MYVNIWEINKLRKIMQEWKIQKESTNESKRIYNTTDCEDTSRLLKSICDFPKTGNRNEKKSI